MKHFLTLLAITILTISLSAPVDAALFFCGNRYAPVGGQSFGEKGAQYPGNLYGYPSQSGNSGSSSTGGGGGSSSGGGGSSGGSTPLTQLALLDTTNTTAAPPTTGSGSSNPPPPPTVPVTIGGIFPEDFDPTGGQTQDPEYVPVTIGGIFPEDFDPWVEDDDPGLTDPAHLPEPASMILLGAGLFGIGLRARRKTVSRKS